jgi:hypothetical protein
MKGTWLRVRGWLKGLASIGDFIEAAVLVILVATIVIGGLFILGKNFLAWLR